jgi:hypothetical protein
MRLVWITNKEGNKMRTTKITSALRDANLPEDKYFKRKHVQRGWYFNNGRMLQNTYDETDQQFQMKWATKVMGVISAAGFQSEIVYEKQHWGMPPLTEPKIVGIWITGITGERP